MKKIIKYLVSSFLVFGTSLTILTPTLLLNYKITTNNVDGIIISTNVKQEVNKEVQKPTLISSSVSINNFIFDNINEKTYSIDIINDQKKQQTIIDYMNKFPSLFLNNTLTNLPQDVKTFKDFTFTLNGNSVNVSFNFLTELVDGNSTYEETSLTFTNFNNQNTIIKPSISEESPFFLKGVNSISSSNINEEASLEVINKEITNNLRDIFINYSETFINSTNQKVQVIRIQSTTYSNVFKIDFNVKNAFFENQYVSKNYTTYFSGFRIDSTPQLISTVSVKQIDIPELTNLNPIDVVNNVNLQNKIIDIMNSNPQYFISNYIVTPVYSQFKNVHFYVQSDNSLLVNCSFLTNLSSYSPVYSEGKINLIDFTGALGGSNENTPSTSGNFNMDSSTM